MPGYQPDLDAWVASAYAVRERWPAAEAGPSLSIPTWFYGHEPTNLFATGIAKYFANALREDTLLHRCRGGIVYLPGQAGTVQEIFQAVTENFYAADAHPDRPDGPGRGGLLDRAAARLAAAAAARRRPADGRGPSTASTTSPRRPTC